MKCFLLLNARKNIIIHSIIGSMVWIIVVVWGRYGIVSAMKIENMNTQHSLPVTGAEHGSKAQAAVPDFSLELSNQDSGMSKEQMQALLNKIDEQGARLTNTPTYDELKEYRNLIKNFVGEAVSQMYAMTSQAGWDRFGRQKIYITVRNIDKELEGMAEKIRLGQSDQLDIVASHDAIRGMLVDLYM